VRDRNSQKNNVSPKKIVWLTNHGDALCLLGILIFSLSFFINLGNGFLWAADEKTYTQMSVHMVKTGDYLNPQGFGESALWTGKPPLVMWLMSLSFQVFGINNFAARFWIPIFGALSLVLVFYLGKKLYNRQVGFLSALVLGTFTTFYVYATHAMIDVPLVFFVLASLYFLLLSENGKNTVRYAALSGVCFGLALLTKQTGSLLIPLIAITYFTLTRRSIRFIFTKSFALFLGAAFLFFAPWQIYMTFRFGTNFWADYFLYSTYTRAVSPIEGHAGSYLFYINHLATSENLLWVILLPFAVGLSAYSAIKRSKAGILIVSWVAIVLLVFTVIQTKIYYYILPAYPAFALAIGALLYQLSSKTWRFVSKLKNAQYNKRLFAFFAYERSCIGFWTKRQLFSQGFLTTYKYFWQIWILIVALC
jgi:4-amino-4-deoxy-L-arabinose transferase-like glycosyltransferase